MWWGMYTPCPFPAHGGGKLNPRGNTPCVYAKRLTEAQYMRQNKESLSFLPSGSQVSTGAAFQAFQ